MATTRDNQFYLELYRQEYEEYMGTSSYDTSKKLFTEQQQIIRYSKHLGFWMMKFDLIKLNKPPDYDSHALFILTNILSTNNWISLVFPRIVVDTIQGMAIGARDMHRQIITGFSSK